MAGGARPCSGAAAGGHQPVHRGPAHVRPGAHARRDHAPSAGAAEGAWPAAVVGGLARKSSSTDARGYTLMLRRSGGRAGGGTVAQLPSWPAHGSRRRRARGPAQAGHRRVCSREHGEVVDGRPEPVLGRAFGATRGPAMTRWCATRRPRRASSCGSPTYLRRHARRPGLGVPPPAVRHPWHRPSRSCSPRSAGAPPSSCPPTLAGCTSGR